MGQPLKADADAAASRSHWRGTDAGIFEYHVAPGLVGGYVYWIRPTRTWAAELTNIPPANAGERPGVLSVSDLPTPLAAQEWVEFAWHRVTANAKNN